MDGLYVQHRRVPLMIPIAPVHVWEGASIRRTLTDIEGAANFLLIKWPANMMDTDAHRTAQVAALDALGGHATAEEFRRAFASAAAEAGILAEEIGTPPALPKHIARPSDFRRTKRRR